MSRPATAANPTTITGARYAARCTDQPSASAVATTRATTTTAATGMRSERTGQGYASTVEAETNYSSGDDYLVEFLGYSFSFNAEDFEQRVTAAAVKLGLLSRNELDEDETADLVELVERAGIEEPRSALGRYLVRRWDEVSLVGGESLVYWLKKLVFRGAWLDHHLKEGKLEVGWDDEAEEFSYRDPGGGRALLELLPTPSWHELQYRP